jgi:hypothetical protein
MSYTNEDQYPSTPQTKSMLPTCLVSCLVLFVVLLIGSGVAGWLLYTKFPGWAAGKGADAIVKEIEKSELAEEDKQQVITQVRRIQDAVESGEISWQDAPRVAERIMESPLLTIGMVQLVYKKYVVSSGLSDQEKATAELTLQRVARGMSEEKITFQQIEQGPLPRIAYQKDEHRWEFKQSVDDETLRKFLDECQQLADTAEIPEEEYRVNIGEEMKQLVDDILAE